MKTCGDYECLIGLAVDGLLEDHEKAELEQHLAVCPACRKKMKDYQEMTAALKEPVDIPENLHSHIMAGVSAQRRRQNSRRWVRRLGAAAAAVVLCFAVIGGSRMLKGVVGEDFASDLMAGGEAAPESLEALPERPVPMEPEMRPVPQPEPQGGSANGGLLPGRDGILDPAKPESKNEAVIYCRLDVALKPAVPPEEPLIPFAGDYAYNCFVDGELEAVRELLGGRELTGENYPGYRFLEVGANLQQVYDKLKESGIRLVEDVRNVTCSPEEMPETGVLSFKIS